MEAPQSYILRVLLIFQKQEWKRFYWIEFFLKILVNSSDSLIYKYLVDFPLLNPKHLVVCTKDISFKESIEIIKKGIRRFENGLDYKHLSQELMMEPLNRQEELLIQKEY